MKTSHFLLSQGPFQVTVSDLVTMADPFRPRKHKTHAGCEFYVILCTFKEGEGVPPLLTSYFPCHVIRFVSHVTNTKDGARLINSLC